MTETDATYFIFDCETTGVDVFNDRIIQLVAARADANGNVLAHQEWLIDPGVEISEEATAIHGFTNEYLRAEGVDPYQALWEADLMFKQAVRDDLVFVAYNLNFDLSILTAEMARNRLESRYGFWIADNVRLFDPMVADRARDRYRKGKRRLMDLAPHYGVVLDEAKLHNALYDVETTAKVAVAVARKFGIPSNAEQTEMHATWAENFEIYLRGVRKDDSIVINGDWPVRLPEKEEA